MLVTEEEILTDVIEQDEKALELMAVTPLSISISPEQQAPSRLYLFTQPVVSAKLLLTKERKVIKTMKMGVSGIYINIASVVNFLWQADLLFDILFQDFEISRCIPVFNNV